MHRKDFIKTCGMVCMGGTALAALLQSCSSMKVLNGTIIDADLVVPLSHFANTARHKSMFRNYIVVQHEKLQYPVCVYRINEHEYTALWMRCTHQGTELQVFGDKLQCPAHGSEFTSHGKVSNGPADANLRIFPVTIDGGQLKISLK